MKLLCTRGTQCTSSDIGGACLRMPCLLVCNLPLVLAVWRWTVVKVAPRALRDIFAPYRDRFCAKTHAHVRTHGCAHAFFRLHSSVDAI